MVNQDKHALPLDQAQRLRQLVSQHDGQLSAAHSSHIIAVASGKGGVGKTLISVNLAIALAARGHRVVLFDLDMGLANADIMLGVEAVHTWSDLLSGRRCLDEVIVHGPGEVALVPGASGIARLANLSEFERHQLIAAMREIECRYDVIVIDCGAGISRNVVGFGAAADTILVVATPEPTSVTDAYAMIKAFALDRGEQSFAHQPAASIGLLVNMADTRKEGRETYERLAGVAARFLHLPVTDYGYILRDEHVLSAVRARHPVILRYPHSPASTCMMASAARLSKEMGAPQAGQSLFYRVMKMFV